MRYFIRKYSIFFWASVVCVLCSVSISIMLVRLQNEAEPGRKDPESGVSRQVRYGFTVRNNTANPIGQASLWVYAPVQKTDTQRCERIRASHCYELETDCMGNQVLHFSLADIPPFGSEVVTIKADLIISQNPAGTGSAEAADLFVQPESHVESDHPLLAEHAASLQKEMPLDTAKSIFAWVAGHIRDIGYQRHGRGALEAFSGAEGDCTEYADLFTALCRAADIPCMRVGGYVSGKNTVLTPSGYHNWARFYRDGQWHVADPQNGVFMKNSGDYIAMHIISEHCPNEMKHYNRYRIEGEGVSVKMNP